MSRILRLGSDHPWLTLAMVVILTAISIRGLVDPSGEVRLRVDPSMESLLPVEGDERELYEYSRKLFGTDESIVVALGAEDVFEPDVLRTVVRLTDRLAEIEGVQGVLSLSTAQTLRSLGDDLMVVSLLEEVPEDRESLEGLRREVLDNPLFAGTLVARDGEATALLVSLERMSDRELLSLGVDAKIVAVAQAEAPGLEVWVAGAPHQKAFTSNQLSSEISWMLPTILGLVGVVLAVSIRTIRGVLLPLAAIVCALIWTLGTLSWLGQQLNLVTISIPALILTVGFTYALHVVVEYYAENREVPEGEPREEVVRRTLDAVAVPVVVTGITTAAGFLSLTLNPIPAVREFGMFALLGVGFTMLSALTLVPAALALLPRSRSRAPAQGEGLFERSADALARLAVDRRRTVIVCSLLVLGVAMVGMTQIRVAIKFPGNMDPEHPVRVHWEEINERLGGANQLRLIFETDLPGAILEPTLLMALRELQEWLEVQPDVGETASIVDYLMMCNRAFNGGDPEYFRVPATRRLASQLLLFCGSQESRRLIDNPRQTTSVLVNATVGDSDRLTDLSARIEQRMTQLPSSLTGAVTGNAALLLKVQDEVSRGQLLSLSAAFVLIYLVLVVMFMDFRVGLIALLPNALPIAIYFGALGFTGVTLNPSTSLVGSLALGIAVDDTIH
ncbi:MAG: efflux RND transporter permease subunit, partial [Myxococcota bacterium]